VRALILTLLLAATASAETMVIQAPGIVRRIDSIQWLSPVKSHPRVALVLSGGGARGFAHIGVLRAWEEAGLPLDLIVGTSVGGILGGLYAAGYSADSLADIAGHTNWSALLSNTPSRGSLFLSRRQEREEAVIEVRFDGYKPRIPTALSYGQNLSDFLELLTRAVNYRIRGDFDRLTVPLRVVATDLISGERVVIGSGNLSDALRSTLAIPLAFTPWESDGRLLADGGLLDPIPVDVARSLGAEIVVAVNTTSPLLPRDELTDPLALANQATSIMVLQRQREQLQAADFVITPSLGRLSNSDFGKTGILMKKGYEAAREVVGDVAAAIATRAASGPDSLRWVVKESRGHGAPPSVQAGDTVSHAGLSRMLEDIASHGDAVRASVLVTSSSDTAVLEWQVERLPVLAAVKITGNTLVPSERLLTPFERFTGRSLQGDSLCAAINTIEAAYHGAGYPLATLSEARLDAQGGLSLRVQEEPVASITISGNKRTRPGVIRRCFPDMIGRPLREADLNYGISAAHATGLFESVTARAARSDSGAMIDVHVVEQHFTRLRLGLHWHEEFHAETIAELADMNVFGTGHKAAVSALYGDRRKTYTFGLNADRIFSTYLTYNLAIYHSRREWRRYVLGESIPGEYKFEHTGARFSLGHQLRRFGTAALGVRAEHVADRLIPGYDRDYELRALSLEARLDTYDRFPFPRRGYRQVITLEKADEFFGGDARFLKFGGEAEGVLTLWKEHAVVAGARAGTADTRLPEPERFVMGGRNSFMGWRTGEGRGDHFWAGELGLRVRLPGRRFLTLIYNVGNIWTNGDKIDLLDVIHGGGAAFAIDSPAGPLEISVGIAEKRKFIGYVHLGMSF
jgi:NTE family protein